MRPLPHRPAQSGRQSAGGQTLNWAQSGRQNAGDRTLTWAAAGAQSGRQSAGGQMTLRPGGPDGALLVEVGWLRRQAGGA